MTINSVDYPKIDKQDFPWYCEQGCFKAMYCSNERVLQMKASAVKYQLWTCPKCGNTVRVCIWRRRGKLTDAKQRVTFVDVVSIMEIGTGWL